MKISIVIPSRERGRYLQHSLATAIAIDDPNLEIIVSDNASTDNTREVTESCDDPRVRYVNTGARLSMRQNFELGLRKSTGDYVIMFGDDDGIIAGQFPYLREALERDRPDTLSWDFLTYGWPSEGYGSKAGGIRLRRDKSFGPPFQIDAQARLKALEHGHRSMDMPLPVLYHGCMSRAYLDRLKGPTGDYFKSMSPDLYISFRALQHGGHFMHMHHPLSINGFSPASTGGSMDSLGRSNEAKADMRFLSEIKTDKMQDVIPVTKSMALAFLGTLQTVMARHPDEPVEPDFFKWYQMVLIDQNKKDADTAAEIAASLDAHADQFNSHDALARARKIGAPSRLARAHQSLVDNLKKWHSFRISTEINQANTILTAAQSCDLLLRDDMAAIMSGKSNRNAAWANARVRSKSFQRQL